MKLEKILPREKNIDYPVCIAGARACPPEDCGGIGGYANLLKIIMDLDHKEYEEMIEWAGGDFDPEHFKPDEVCGAKLNSGGKVERRNTFKNKAKFGAGGGS